MDSEAVNVRRALDVLRVAGAALFAIVLTQSPAANGQAISFSGQRVTIVVGTPAGGAYDAFARLVSRHLGRFVAGNPGMIVQNMPGAGSLIAANWLAKSAARDGTVIATLPSGTLSEAMLGNPAARFDARRLNLLGSLDDFSPVVAVWGQTPFTTPRDLLTHEMLVGASGADSNNSVVPNLLNSLLHTKFKVINGYEGGNGVEMAMERGETQAMVGNDWDSIKATKPDWLRDKKIRILLQVTLGRNPELPDVPTALEFVSEENRDVLTLLIARQTYSGLFLTPPDVPAPVVAALRDGFAKMSADADFKRDAEVSHLTLHPASAEDVTAALDKLLASPPSVIERATAELRRVIPQ